MQPPRSQCLDIALHLGFLHQVAQLPNSLPLSTAMIQLRAQLASPRPRSTTIRTRILNSTVNRLSPMVPTREATLKEDVSGERS